MNKNGFTLIELLAVIVILAIIAVIAVPIVLNIINDSKENSNLRSAEFYLDAAEMSVAGATLKDKNIPDGTYNILESGNICLETYNSTTKTCVDKNNDKNIDELKVEVNGEVPESGTIKIAGGTISLIELNYKEGKTIVKDDKGELVYREGETIEKGKFSSVCKLANDSTIQGTNAGAKYTCEVKEGTSYNFYVLTTPQSGDTSINLIMDRNICKDGTPATAENTCLVAYNSYGDAAGTGPETAMTYLNNATSTWENIDNLNIEYNDEGGNFSKFAITGKARLPRYDEVHGEGKCLIYSENGNKYGSCPLWLSNYLNSSSDVTGEGLQNISGINGYWTLSSNAGGSGSAWIVHYNGYVVNPSVDYGYYYGVRAVINLKI